VRTGDRIGVIVAIMDSSADSNPPRWELHVDAAEEGQPTGTEIWEPWQTELADDDVSIEEARRQGPGGLRGA
jgi:hypothetical protein